MNRKIFGIAFAALTILGTQSAAAYDYKVCSQSGDPASYVHVVVVSAFCHDRTPVDVKDGDPPFANSCISGTTAPGCLVEQVAFVLNKGAGSWNATFLGGNLPGVAGGTFTYDGIHVCRDVSYSGQIFTNTDQQDCGSPW